MHNAKHPRLGSKCNGPVKLIMNPDCSCHIIGQEVKFEKSFDENEDGKIVLRIRDLNKVSPL